MARAQSVGSSESLSTEGARRVLRACNLNNRIVKELDFLACVESVADVLYVPEVVRLSILRYEHLWLPVCQQSLEALNPPLDIAFIQHCHLLCPTRYFVDCRNLVGKAPAFDFFRPSSDTHCSAGEAAWAKMYPSLPFHVNFDSVKGAVADMLESLSSVLGLTPAEANPQQILPALPTSCLTYDLEAAVQRQKSFYYQVSLPHYRDAQFIENAIDRYTTFLMVKRSHLGRLCPSYDIELVWHSHMTLPQEYRSDTEALLGSVLPYDDSVNDRTPGKDLTSLKEETEALFSKWGEQLFQCGGMFRGLPQRLTPEEHESIMPSAPVCSLELVVVSCHITAAKGKNVDVKLKRWQLVTVNKKLFFECLNMEPWLDSNEPLHLRPTDGPKRLKLQGDLFTESSGWVEFTSKCDQQITPFSLMKEGDGKIVFKAWAQLPGSAALARSLVDAGRVHITMEARFRPCFSPLQSHILTPNDLKAEPVASAAESASQPGLVIPLHACGHLRDKADVVNFKVAMGDSRAAAATPLHVKVINTSRHLATTVEVHAHLSGDEMPDQQVPCVTAHSANLSTLPHMGMVSQGSCCPSLVAEECMRAFVILDGDIDWAVLTGKWEGQKKKKDDTDSDAWPGGLEWSLHLIDGPAEQSKYTVKPQPNVNADRYKYYKQVAIQIEDGIKGLLHVNLANGVTTFHVLSDESEEMTAKQAGRINALLTAVSTCIGIMHAWCMPCTSSVTSPEQPKRTMEEVINDISGTYNKWSTCAWCKPVMASWNVPTNGFVCEELANQQAGSIHGKADQSVWKVPGSVRMPREMLPWFSTAEPWETSAIARRFWGGVLSNRNEFAASVHDADRSTTSSYRASSSMRGLRSSRSLRPGSGRMELGSGRMDLGSGRMDLRSKSRRGMQVALPGTRPPKPPGSGKLNVKPVTASGHTAIDDEEGGELAVSISFNGFYADTHRALGRGGIGSGAGRENIIRDFSHAGGAGADFGGF